MATDPNMSDDQKRRQRERESGGLRRALGGLGGPAMAMGALTRLHSGAAAEEIQDSPAGTLAGLVTSPAAQMARNRDRNAEKVTAPPQQAPQPQRRAARFNVPGLSRVTKTADGVYTDDPSAQGDVRYYDATGMRADTGVPQGITRNTTVDEYNAAERAAALDPNDPAAQQQIIARGKRSIGLMRGLQEEAAERAANAGSWITDESGERRIYTAEEVANGVAPQQGGGLRRGSAAGKNPTAPDFGDLLNLKEFQYQMANDRDQRGVEAEQYADERYDQFVERLTDVETGGQDQAISEFFGQLTGLTPAERANQIVSSPEGRAILGLYTQNLRESAQPGALNPMRLLQFAGLAEDSGSIRPSDTEPGVFGTRRLRRDPVIGESFSGDEVLNLQPEWLRAIEEADALLQARGG